MLVSKIKTFSASYTVYLGSPIDKHYRQYAIDNKVTEQEKYIVPL